MNTNRYLALILTGAAVLSLLLSLILPEGLGLDSKNPKFTSVLEIATKIQNREDVRIIDLRPVSKYDSFHLPTAESVPFDKFEIEDIRQDRPVVYYSGDDGISKKLWDRLPANIKTNSSILYGGVHDWFDRILYPKLPILPMTSSDSLISIEINNLSEFYGGQPKYIRGRYILDYYLKDMQKARWPIAKRNKGLVRMGC